MLMHTWHSKGMRRLPVELGEAKLILGQLCLKIKITSLGFRLSLNSPHTQSSHSDGSVTSTSICKISLSAPFILHPLPLAL